MEVEFHHVDLGVGYAVADWPEPFATYCLTRVAADFARPDGLTLQPPGPLPALPAWR
jgi:hypothetical protein